VYTAPGTPIRGSQMSTGWIFSSLATRGRRASRDRNNMFRSIDDKGDYSLYNYYQGGNLG
jgi:hypothetical protein